MSALAETQSEPQVCLTPLMSHLKTFLQCQDNSNTIAQNNYVSFNSRTQWTTLTMTDLALFTNKVYLI